VDAHDWWELAACRDLDPDLFDYDPEVDPPTEAEAAKQVCASCQVRDACLEFALTTIRRREDLTGIYGGLTPAERTDRRGPEEPRWRWWSRDPQFAARSLTRARQVGIEATARELGVAPKTLRRAWDRHGLGRPPRRPAPPVNLKITRPVAERAFQVARQTSIKAAARQFGVTRPGLSAAWERYGLGHPHEGLSAAELRARWNRDHWWRRDERVRRLQAAAERRQRQQLRQLRPGQPLRPKADQVPEPGGRRPRELRLDRDQERER
jgi:WhiB family transcriptional regulator, redox-sensing transcriptional regulator